MKNIWMAAAAVAILVGCSGAPGAGEVEDAFGEFLQQQNPDATMEDFALGECRAMDERAGYACSITATVTYPVGFGVPAAPRPLTSTFVFEQIEDQWRVMGKL